MVSYEDSFQTHLSGSRVPAELVRSIAVWHKFCMAEARLRNPTRIQQPARSAGWLWCKSEDPVSYARVLTSASTQ
ncbi:hypothetical protein CS8_012580 [Cupriavidus sp. 8B]